MVQFPVVPDRMALLNVDLQNCFVRGAGADGQDVLERVNRVARACRAAGIPVWSEIELAWRLQRPRRDGRYAPWLAVTGTKRSPFFPETPTLDELGIRGVELGNWFGVFAPAAFQAGPILLSTEHRSDRAAQLESDA